ncbi:MAG: ATP-dependent Clp protease adaptor ClpS [Myxococcota bacterium]|nr:ATP-dependent Clp protease adaptor ClpS [Myxococcota bacterium]
MSDHGRPNEELQGDLAVRTKRPRRFRIVIHNDDYSTMDFVVEVLTRFFQKSRAESVELMLTVHNQGAAAVGVYSRDLAETLLAEVRRFARNRKQPLQLTMEPE